jgi:hypothetical protein
MYMRVMRHHLWSILDGPGIGPEDIGPVNGLLHVSEWCVCNGNM